MSIFDTNIKLLRFLRAYQTRQLHELECIVEELDRLELYIEGLEDMMELVEEEDSVSLTDWML